MQALLMFAPVAAPVLFWAAYHYYKDRALPEPVGNLLLTFALGVLAVAISSALYNGLGLIGLRSDAGLLADTDSLALFAYAMLAIGPIEEIAKIIPFLVIVVRFKEFDEPLDGIIYASFIGLGYAAMENWQYLDYLTTTAALARGFASPVIHMVFASIWGHWIAQAHLNGRSVAPAAMAGLILASGLHGLYDFVVILNPRHSLPIAALGIVTIWLWRLKLMRAMHEAASQDR